MPSLAAPLHDTRTRVAFALLTIKTKKVKCLEGETLDTSSPRHIVTGTGADTRKHCPRTSSVARRCCAPAARANSALRPSWWLHLRSQLRCHRPASSSGAANAVPAGFPSLEGPTSGRPWGGCAGHGSCVRRRTPPRRPGPCTPSVAGRWVPFLAEGDPGRPPALLRLGPLGHRSLRSGRAGVRPDCRPSITAIPSRTGCIERGSCRVDQGAGGGARVHTTGYRALPVKPASPTQVERSRVFGSDRAAGPCTVAHRHCAVPTWSLVASSRGDPVPW